MPPLLNFTSMFLISITFDIGLVIYGKHYSSVSYPIPGNNWLIKMKNMCVKTCGDWLGNVHMEYYHMYPLRYGRNASKITATYSPLASEFQYHFRPVSYIQNEEKDIYDPNGQTECKKLLKTTHYPGVTVLPECFWQGGNPAHLIFPLGVFYEWGLSRPSHLPMFDRAVLFKCDSWEDMLHTWEWGRVLLEVSFSKWEKIGLFPSQVNDKIPESIDARKYLTKFQLKQRSHRHQIAPQVANFPLPHIFSPTRNNTSYEHVNLHCFDELYLVQRWGTILSDQSTTQAFREDVNKYLKAQHASDSTTTTATTNANIEVLNDSTLLNRCVNKSLRVIIQQRQVGEADDRKILNIEQVISAASRFTTHASQFSLHLDSLSDQIARYNSFDVLVTMTGSHLVNLVYTNRSNVAVLEVGLAIRNWFWRDNAYRFGIKHYYYNHVGSIPSKKCYNDSLVDDRCQPVADTYHHETISSTEPSIIECPPSRPQDEWNAYTGCSFYVNVTTFSQQLHKTIQALCVQ